MLSCGAGRQELRVGRLSAPPRVDATRGNVPALGDGPVALFLDVDGTLLDLAERPDEVVTPAVLVATLARAERKLDGALALISGRAIDDLDRLFAPLSLRASGVHGAEIRFNPGESATPTPSATELPQSLSKALRAAVEAFPGAFVETKRFSIAVHYRLAPTVERPLREAVMQVVESAGAAVEVMDAHYAIELKTPGFDKGGAIAAFLATPAFHGRTPVFVGDDATDERGFAVVAARGGCAYSVGRRLPGAIGAFSDPSAVRDWLAEFAYRGDGA
jgi:trehalose 6-phosphate phosphatase